MQETTGHENVVARLEAAEHMVVSRLDEIGAKLNQDYWPQNMGMILAAEGVESRFSLGSPIVNAVWTGELSNEQLNAITSKLEDKKRLVTLGDSDLEKDILVLGRLLTRIKTDLKGIFANAQEQKANILTNILKSVDVIFAEYEKEKAGEVRSFGVREYFESGTEMAIDNVKKLGQTYESLDKNSIQLAVDRYQILLEVIRDIDPNLILNRDELMKLNDAYHSIFSLGFADDFELKICTDEEFAVVLKTFYSLQNK